MSYLVLARKHRPQSFDEVIGQSHITDILRKGIDSDRVAHAYLFSGPRGVGKTTCARILAMCLNCEAGPTSNIPKDSIIAREIADGRSFDVLEIDGASNRGIDEVRALRENVKFSPTQGKYKIYIVDEVHMLTSEAFNALLKTLEEPPEHAKFIFATTEPNKVPATIISRCQRFDFKRIPIKMIVDGLKEISKREKYTIDENALYSIAKAAQGSLRDALSTLDQLSALSDKGIKEEDVYSMLGIVEVQLVFDLVDSIGDKDCAKALNQLNDIINKGKDIKQLIKDLTEHFRHLMVINIGGKSLGKLVDYPVAIKELILVQTQKFTLQEILAAIDGLIQAQEAARVTESIRMPLEVAIARMTYGDALRQAPKPVQATASPKPPRIKPAEILKNNKGAVDLGAASKPDPQPQAQLSADEIDEDTGIEETATLDSTPTDLDLDHIIKVWDILTSAVSKEKMSVATYLQEGMPTGIKGEYLIVGFPHRCNFQKSALEDNVNTQLVERIFSDKLRNKVLLRFELVKEIQEVDNDTKVQSTLDAFGGKVINKWHNE